MTINGIWHGDDDHRDYDDEDRAPWPIDDDTTARLPVRESVSVETMIEMVRGVR